LLQWARSQGAPLTEDAAWLVARKGKLEWLERLRELGCPMGTYVYVGVAHTGRLEVMEWAKLAGVELDKWTALSLVNEYDDECSGLGYPDVDYSAFREWVEAQP